MNTKKWKFLNKASSRAEVLQKLLNQRGYKTDFDVQNFKYPPKLENYLNLFDSEFIKSINDAKKLINEQISSNGMIVIHGDYDSDGICSTSILFRTLVYELKYPNVPYIIPNRFEHGYGVSIKSVDTALLKANNASNVLFITVDSGITSVKEIDYIKSLGHKVIITDHHQKPSLLPKADVIVWNDQMVGAGIALVLSLILGSTDPQNIALSAVATVTDLQPLKDFNRSLVKKGLEILNSNPPLGLKFLLNESKKNAGDITVYDLGWLIGPRLNASGRLEDASRAVELLVDTNSNKISQIAQELNNLNLVRQNKTVEMYDLAVDADNKLSKVIISHNSSYHEGIIGLVAARLVQKHYRPAIVMSISDGFAKGSVRSIAGVDIISMLRNFEDMFESLGGHPMAAGFNISLDKLTDFKKAFTLYADAHISDDLLIPELTADLLIPLSLIDLELLSEIELMTPFGIGNEEPLFMSENAGIVDASYVGKEKNHLSLKIFVNGKYLKGILFHKKDILGDLEISAGDHVDLIYSLRKNEFNGKVSVDLFLKDIKFCNHQ